MKKFTFFVTFILCSFAFANSLLDLRHQHVFTRSQLEREVNEQQLSTQQGTAGVSVQGGDSCLKTACSMVGSLGCDSREEVFELSRECRNETCLKVTCEGLGYFACDENSEVREVLRKCS